MAERKPPREPRDPEKARRGRRSGAAWHACERSGPLPTFHLLRLEDETGVSGTGCVAEGAVFSNGWVALIWLTGTPSMSFYPSIHAVEAIHGHGGLTKIVFN